MSYIYITRHTSPNQSRSNNRRIRYIVIHHWDDPKKKPSFDGVVSWLCRPNGSSSAHYVVQEGVVACLVSPKNVAWHAGDWTANRESIGIECSPYATDGDYQTVAQLIRELRATYGDLPLYPHKKFMLTSCPGAWDLDRLDRLARGQTELPATKPSAKPSKPNNSGKSVWPDKALTLTGKHDTESHNAWVKLLSSVGYKDRSLTTAMQKWLRDLGYYKRGIDTIFGYYTVVALQRFLEDRGHYTRAVDGQRGKHTIIGEKKYLNEQRKYFT